MQPCPLAVNVGSRTNRCDHRRVSAVINFLKDFFRPSRVSETGVRLLDVVTAPYVRLAALTSLAGTFGYYFGALFPNASPVTSAIIAMVSMRPFFRSEEHTSELQSH